MIEDLRQEDYQRDQMAAYVALRQRLPVWPSNPYDRKKHNASERGFLAGFFAAVNPAVNPDPARRRSFLTMAHIAEQVRNTPGLQGLDRETCRCRDAYTSYMQLGYRSGRRYFDWRARGGGSGDISWYYAPPASTDTWDPIHHLRAWYWHIGGD